MFNIYDLIFFLICSCHNTDKLRRLLQKHLHLWLQWKCAHVECKKFCIIHRLVIDSCYTQISDGTPNEKDHLLGPNGKVHLKQVFQSIVQDDINN